MTRVVLANVDYQRHMTNEGDQFQEGLRAAGWTLSGVGYDGLQDVPAILERYAPTHVVVHDKRDWDPRSAISFRKDVGFERLSTLRAWHGRKAVVIKDAASSIPYHEQFYREVEADAAIVSYHPDSITRHAPWMRGKPMVRTYHTLDARALPALDRRTRRRPALISGALSHAYPMRQWIVGSAQLMGIDVLRHPGYSNRGARTGAYLETLAQYRVHIATASRYGFALRKIIESVAMGCAVLTDLPAYDVLPEIDGALTRIEPGLSLADVRDLVAQLARTWHADERGAWAEKARAFYDYRAMGARLDAALSSVAMAA